ncbi:hypothetical protein lerEdw1_009161 [Lerista edwardsae]|nr:hypothetical protein lerEdw1_009161 [Lerista edwardsae]
MGVMKVSFETWSLKNETCRSSVDLDLMLHYSLLPSAVIILLLSCLEKRARRRSVDEKCPLLDRRGGVIVPLDFVGAFSNRWSLGFAFGATADKVMVMFSEGYIPLHVPTWAKAFVVLIGALEVGLSSYPFFACLSTHFQITGAILGFLYSGTWFAVTLVYIVQCPHGQVIGEYENVVFYWPPLLCLAFLLGKFAHMFVSALQVRTQQDLPSEKTSFLEVHQAHYVQQLMRKPPLQQPQKSWIQRNIYDWDPHFRFPTRMISTAVFTIICLYIFVVFEFYVYKLVSGALETLAKNFEALVASGNASEATASSVQHMNEILDVTEGVWLFTTYTAYLTCISYVFHILVCYR